MVGTIAPLVQAARQKWLVGVSMFMAASAAGGLAFGVTLGFVGDTLPELGAEQFTSAILVGVAVALAAIEAWWPPVIVPTLHRSVPQRWWLRYGPNRAALAYGAVLGIGVTTFIPFASFFLLPVAALVVGPLLGGAIGASYGLGRALPVLFASLAMAGGVPPVDIGRWLINNDRRRVAKRLCALVLLGCALGFLLP